MAQEYLPDSLESACPELESGKPKREAVRMLILGTPAGVREEINTYSNGDLRKLAPGVACYQDFIPVR